MFGYLNKFQTSGGGKKTVTTGEKQHAFIRKLPTWKTEDLK